MAARTEAIFSNSHISVNINDTEVILVSKCRFFGVKESIKLIQMHVIPTFIHFDIAALQYVHVSD